MLKALFVLEMVMVSQTGQQIITIHILPNILRIKDNQTLKLGQLIEYNKRNIFLEKSHTKCGGEACPRPIHENSTLIISLDQQSEMLQNLFLLYVQMEVYQNLLKLRLITCFCLL